MEDLIRYIHHQHKDSPAHLADGAYCFTGFNGNILLQFFQQLPTIPNVLDVGIETFEVKNQGEVFADMGEGGIERVFIGKIQMTKDSVKQLIHNLQGAISEAE